MWTSVQSSSGFSKSFLENKNILLNSELHWVFRIFQPNQIINHWMVQISQSSEHYIQCFSISESFVCLTLTDS